jgi:Arc/MetJ-type ribon-helix-helix transcriptional regulator
MTSLTRSAAQSSTGVGALGSDTIAPLSSRPTTSPFHEKNDIAVKAMVSERVNDDLRKFARDNGFTSQSDLIREALKLVLYGEQHVLNMHRARIEALAKNLTYSCEKGDAE